ncbi:hypothetical protein RJ639_041116 [Escallonia herrerae]|uniref:Uncharacterized protein n=1 Tax=Escallonia herrerae TaxID=1293975 RepID=A0AA88WKQ7_9ASTE|nr:hypothetical protein RJ639_041116 [Escallonia herrerae]
MPLGPFLNCLLFSIHLYSVDSYDADFAGDPDDRKSTTGYVFLIGGAAISWLSKKQACVAKYTRESKFVACSTAAAEAVQIKRFLKDLNLSCIADEAILIFNDNKVALKAIKNGEIGPKDIHLKLMLTSELDNDGLTNAVVFRDLIYFVEEEYGLPMNGPITAPCDASFMECAVSIVRRHPVKDMDKAVLMSTSGSTWVANGDSYGDVLAKYQGCDADFAGDPDNRKLTTGYVFLIGGAAISWLSKKLACVAKYTRESEFVACSIVTAEAVRIKRFLKDLNLSCIDDEAILIFNDNKAAVKAIKNGEIGPKDIVIIQSRCKELSS